jgi:hypothetical protein
MLKIIRTRILKTYFQLDSGFRRRPAFVVFEIGFVSNVGEITKRKKY